MRENVSAVREVIICAGAINTPQLLMLSGIGPAKHLKHHEVNLNLFFLHDVKQNFFFLDSRKDKSSGSWSKLVGSFEYADLRKSPVTCEHHDEKVATFTHNR